jgi:hypothetical protein
MAMNTYPQIAMVGANSPTAIIGDPGRKPCPSGQAGNLA